jgi:hypothetical protein
MHCSYEDTYSPRRTTPEKPDGGEGRGMGLDDSISSSHNTCANADPLCLACNCLSATSAS